jgi:hypothetical protein
MSSCRVPISTKLRTSDSDWIVRGLNNSAALSEEVGVQAIFVLVDIFFWGGGGGGGGFGFLVRLLTEKVLDCT